MIEAVPAVLTWLLDAVAGFPVYAVGVVLLGVWVFWRGRYLLVEPRHQLDLGGAADGLSSRRAEARTPGRRPFWRRRRQASPLRAGPRARDPGDQGYERIPYHDAPTWLYAWAITFAAAAGLALADTVWSFRSGVPLPLERAVLGRWSPPVPVPLPRPGFALAVYTAAAYLGLEAARALVARVVGLARLHLLDPNDVRRRFARAVFAACGFQDLQRLDPGSARCWLVAGLAACAGLAAADVAVFYAGARGPVGVLAVCHLFPLVVARVFDPVWTYPARYRYTPPQEHARVPVRRIPEVLARDGSIAAADRGPPPEPLVWHLHGNSDGEFRPFGGDESSLPARFLRELVGEARWYAHQKQAWDALAEGRSVLLQGSAGSGKTVVGLTLAVRGAVVEGETAVLVYPDPESCQREYERFCDTLFRTGLRWNLGVVDGTRLDAPSLDWTRESPSILFCDVGGLEDLLLRDRRGADVFLAALGLVVVEDAHRLTGAPASHLYFLSRRLDGLRRGLTARPFRWFATARPVAGALHAGLGTVLGRQLDLIEGNGAPRADVLGCLVTPPAGDRAPPGGSAVLDGFVRKLRALGHDPVLVTPGAARPWQDPERGPVLELQRLPAEPVSVARLDDAGACRIVFALRNAGARTPSAFHVSFWVARPEPFAALLVDLLESFRREEGTAWQSLRSLPLGGAFCFSGSNTRLLERHVEAALAEGSLRPDRPSPGWDEPAVHRTVESLRRRRPELFAAAAGPGPRGAPAVPRSVGGHPGTVAVVDAAGPKDRLVTRVDRAVAGTAFYPGRAFVHAGRRYRVPQDAPPAPVGPVRVTAEVGTVFTTKIRRCSVAWTGDPVAVRSRAGERPFLLRRGGATFREEVSGFREWDEDTNRHLGTHAYADPARPNPSAEFRTTAAQILFPGADLSPPAVRILESVFRSVVRARFGDDDTPPEAPGRDEFSDFPGGDEGVSLWLVDAFPGGAGYVDPIAPGLVLEWLGLMHRLVERVGRRRPSLLLNPPGRQDPGEGDRPVPDPAAVLACLDRDAAGPARGAPPSGADGELAAAMEAVLAFLVQVLPDGAVAGTGTGTVPEEAASPPEGAGDGASELERAYAELLEQTAVSVRARSGNG